MRTVVVSILLFSGSFCRYRKALYSVHLGLLFIWRSFVFCLLFLLFYVICAAVPAEGTFFLDSSLKEF